MAVAVVAIGGAGAGLRWYKWSRSGHFLGTDPTNWRKSFQDLGERPRRDRVIKKYRRKPTPSVAKGSIRFAGYAWICPVCGKTCQKLYYPAERVNFLADEQPRWVRRVKVKPSAAEGKFACKNCHRVRFMSRLWHGMWNCVVGYLSGGLLYGSEVERPDWFVPVRQRPFVAHLLCSAQAGAYF